jgi:hypothetical protein
MSDELKQFYRDIHAAIDSGCETDWFCLRHGLCVNVTRWAADKPDCHGLIARMLDQFADAGLHTVYPFNQGCRFDHSDEKCAGRIYQNLRRLQWIKDHAK